MKAEPRVAGNAVFPREGTRTRTGVSMNICRFALFSLFSIVFPVETINHSKRQLARSIAFPAFSPRGYERRANAFLATILLPRSTTSFLSRRGFLTRVESYLDGPTCIRAMFAKRHSSSHKVIRNGEVRLFQVHGLEVVNPATRIGHG